MQIVSQNCLILYESCPAQLRTHYCVDGPKGCITNTFLVKLHIHRVKITLQLYQNLNCVNLILKPPILPTIRVR